VHNTLTVDGQEPDARGQALAGLVVDALEEGESIKPSKTLLPGVLHRRRLALIAGGWLVTDNLLPAPGVHPRPAHLHPPLAPAGLALHAEGENTLRLDDRGWACESPL
jgi:hypothetical protein